MFPTSIHGFSLVWKEKQYLKVTWGEVGRKYSFTHLFCVPQSPWKCLLVGKLIESCSRIKHKIRICILSNNVVGQTSYKFADTYRLVHVNCHSSSRDCCRTNTLTLSFLRSLIRSRIGFSFHVTRRQKKKELCGRILPPYHSSCPPSIMVTPSWD